MTDELITQLASLNNVRVISRTSVMRFRSSKQSLSEIAGALHVDAVVEESVLRQGNRVRITAQLVQAGDERNLWAHSYEGDVTDVIRLQNEVAGSVSENIKATLHPGAQTQRQNEGQLAQQTPQSIPPDAYDAYLKGLYFSAKLTAVDMQKAFDYFKKAIETAPTFAPAYGGLAEAYWGATAMGLLPSPGCFAQGGRRGEEGLGD